MDEERESDRNPESNENRSPTTILVWILKIVEVTKLNYLYRKKENKLAENKPTTNNIKDLIGHCDIFLKKIDNKFTNFDNSNYEEWFTTLGYEHLNFSNNNEKEFIKKKENLENKLGMYIFKEKTNMLEERKWDNFKEKCTGKVSPWIKNRKINKERIFYIGKSEDIYGRLDEHMNCNVGKNTYALRLSAYNSENNKLGEYVKDTFEYEVDVFFIDNNIVNEDNINSALIANTIIKGLIYEKLKPVIGTNRI